MPVLVYAVDFVLCSESEEDLKTMKGRFAEVCRRRGLKKYAGKGKVMVLNREGKLKCKIWADGIYSAHVSEFKYFGTDGAEGSRKVASGKRVAGAIRYLGNAMGL